MVAERISGHLLVRSLEGRWGSFHLHISDFRVHPGEYVVILGPSGCGKTSFVETIAGLRRTTAGTVLLDGRDITCAPPGKRHVGYVPQGYELFPSRVVEENIRFAARIRRERGAAVEARYRRLVAMLRLEGLERRAVYTLSGGEAQRVALARALMAEPRVLLLDEPVSALPETQRDTVCRELYQLQRELGLTTIHVSHNIEEALLVADRIAVMYEGRLVQYAAPDEILDQPATRFVAAFTRCRNIWPAEVRQGHLLLHGVDMGTVHNEDGFYDAVIRPEYVRLVPDGEKAGHFRGSVVERVRATHTCLLRVDIGSFSVWVRETCSHDIHRDTVTLLLPREHIALIPSK